MFSQALWNSHFPKLWTVWHLNLIMFFNFQDQILLHQTCPFLTLSSSYCTLPYIQYINQQMHSIQYNKVQIIKYTSRPVLTPTCFSTRVPSGSLLQQKTPSPTCQSWYSLFCRYFVHLLRFLEVYTVEYRGFWDNSYAIPCYMFLWAIWWFV
jgi:hypothetical protein